MAVAVEREGADAGPVLPSRGLDFVPCAHRDIGSDRGCYRADANGADVDQRTSPRTDQCPPDARP
jgi:hypothetical protein